MNPEPRKYILKPPEKINKGLWVSKKRGISVEHHGAMFHPEEVHALRIARRDASGRIRREILTLRPYVLGGEMLQVEVRALSPENKKPIEHFVLDAVRTLVNSNLREGLKPPMSALHHNSVEDVSGGRGVDIVYLLPKQKQRQSGFDLRG